MLDAYFLETGRSDAPQRVDVRVTEKRAPTDDSVRLLREMEAAAKAEVLAAIPLESNTFKGEMLVSEIGHRPGMAVTILFDFNGKRCKAQVDIFKSDFQSREDAQSGMGRKVRDAIAQALTDSILGEVLTDNIAGALANSTRWL